MCENCVIIWQISFLAFFLRPLVYRLTTSLYNACMYLSHLPYSFLFPTIGLSDSIERSVENVRVAIEKSFKKSIFYHFFVVLSAPVL